MKPRLGKRDGVTLNRCAEGQTDGWTDGWTDCRLDVLNNPGWKKKKLYWTVRSLQSKQMLDESFSLSPFLTLIPQITALQSQHLMSS